LHLRGHLHAGSRQENKQQTQSHVESHHRFIWV
jgi:hypothetical protein